MKAPFRRPSQKAPSRRTEGKRLCHRLPLRASRGLLSFPRLPGLDEEDAISPWRRLVAWWSSSGGVGKQPALRSSRPRVQTDFDQ